MEGIGNIEGRAASLQVEELIGWAAFMEVEEFSRTPISLYLYTSPTWLRLPSPPHP